MAAVFQSESRRMYSWWWDSHISPKNSKWLQENLTDMDTNVKTMIKLIEEDADSFARRAEMYYKKRPELMKLVEEFYRAYRALAERYDHATGALRQAHRTMSEAFPNQIPLLLADEMQSGSSVSDLEPHTPEMPTPIRALFEPEDLQKDGLGVSSHYPAIKRNAAFSEEHDVMSRKGLKQLNEMFATAGAANVKLPEGKVRKGLKFQEEERKNIEPQTLAASKERIRDSCEKEDVDKGLKNLQEEVLRLAKEIQNLESRIKSESERADKAETEIGTLKETISKLDSEKEAALLQCHASSERISNLETEISRTQDDFKKLNSEMMQAMTKLNAAEQRCLHLEKTNKSIKSDFESVEQKAKLFQYELNQKQEELDEVQLSLRTIEEMHFQSKEEVSRLSLGIQSGVEKLKEMELSNMALQEEVRQLKEQNGNLHEETICCAKKRENLQEEIILLKQTKSELEKEMEFHVDEKQVLQEEFCLLKKNRDDLEHRHRDLEEKTQEFSLNIEFLNALIKELQDGNAELNEICKKQEEEKVFYLKNSEKLENVTEKNLVLEKSLADANEELEGLRRKINCLEESCESLQGELSDKVSEQAEVLYQLETTSLQMEKLAETNTILQNSLCDVNVELEAVRMKMNDLEDSYQSLNDERTNLLLEKATLAYQLKAATQNLERLSENNAFLEKSLSEAEITLENLGMRLKGLEESWQSLCDEKTRLIAEKNILVSQLDTTSQYSGKLSEKNALLEKSLSDANTNLDSLGVKLKGLEESFQSLYVEKSNLFVENKNLTSQVESTSKSLESLENKYAELEEKLSNLAEEEVLICNQLAVLQECLKVEKQENETRMQLCKSQLATLENQISFFQEEVQLKEEEIEMEQQRNIDSQIESFIMQRCMLDMIDINLNLSGECQKHLEASSCMEKLTLDMKKENRMQKMKLTSLIEHNKKLIREISLLLKILNIHVNVVSLDDIKDEELLQIILGGTRNLMNSISDSLDEKQQLILEKSVIITVLQHLGLDMDDLITKKGLLELESQIRAKELSVLQSNRDELLEMNGQLRQDLQLSVQRERELKAETDILYGQISYFQEAHRMSQSEVCKLVAGSQSLSNKFDNLKEEMVAKEVENNAMLEEAVALDILSFIFMSLSNERASELKLVHNDMDYLQGVNYDLNQEIGILNQKMEVAEAENMHLKESVASLEECRHRLMTLQNDLTRMQDQCEQLHLQIQISDNLVMHKDLELAEVNQKIQDAHQRSEGEIVKLIEEIQALSEEFYDLKKQKDEVDDENSAILAEVIALECLGMFFRNLNDEISLQLKSYGSDVDRLLRLNNDLYKEIRILNEAVQVSAVESMHLKKQAASLEEDFRISQREISKLSDENKLLSKKLYKIENQRDAVEEENCFLIAKALTVESLYLYFRSLSAERGSEIQLLIDDLDHLSQTKKGLDENLRVIYEKKEVLNVENVHLKNSARDLEKELETSRNFSEQLNFQLRDAKSLLTNKDRELSETNQMIQSLQEKNSEICRELESLNIDIDEAKMLREELQMNILLLSEGNCNKDNEITRLHEEKSLLEGERLRLHEEVKMLKSKEEHLTSELKKRTCDAEQCEKELASLSSDLQICTVNAVLFEEKVFEWIVDCESHLVCAIVKQEMLYEEINVKNASNDELKRTVNNLEGENRGLKDNLNEILTLVTSLWNVMTSLEDETLSLAKFQISKRSEEQDIFLASMAYGGSYEEPKEDHSTSTQQPGVIQLKMLPPKVEKLKKVVLSIKNLLEKERLHSNSWCKEEAVPDDKDDSKICKRNSGQIMKDIQLDQVSSSLLYGGGTCLYRPSRIEISETDDDMLELWETAERDCNKTRPSVANEHDIEFHQIEAVEEVKSEYPSSELMAEKELGIDKPELLKTTTESYEEWKKKVLERLASDAQRLSVLQTGINELKGKMESSEISKTPLCIEYSTVKTQLKEAEGAILQLNDINSKLTRKAEDYSASSSSLTREKEELGKLGRRQLSEHVRRGSEKIGNLELELHKIHYIFLKLEEENENRSKAMERRSSILLRDYIYAKRGTLRKKKGAFCGCMKPKTKG